MFNVFKTLKLISRIYSIFSKNNQIFIEPPNNSEVPPCGPLAFWAFQNRISNESALIVCRHADVMLRDELGCTMLHRIIAKNLPNGKVEIVKKLLERNINISARDVDGYTARDYTYIYSVCFEVFTCAYWLKSPSEKVSNLKVKKILFFVSELNFL